MSSPVKREFPLEKFIGGVVSRLMKTYKIPEHNREDLVQDAWVTIFRVTETHPQEAKNKGYLMRAIVNDLIKVETRDQAKRYRNVPLDNQNTSNSLIRSTASPEEPLVARDLLAKAGLTESETAVCELIYDIPSRPSSVSTVARIMQKSEAWVSARLSAARLKLGITADRI